MLDYFEFEELAISLGFTVDKSILTQGYTFRRGDTHIWNCRDGWQIADLIDGRFQNHRGFKPLKEALLQVVEEQRKGDHNGSTQIK